MIRRGALAAAIALLYALPARATVTSSNTSIPYVCNGTTTVFPVTFPYPAGTIVATTTTAAGAAATLVSGTDYSLSPAAAPSAGALTLTAGSKCPSGSTLLISRVVPLTQLTALRTQGSFLPATVETALDRLAMEIQGLPGPVAPSALSNATPITSRGSTTPVQLQDWTAMVQNAKAWGAVGDNVHDDTANIQACINFLSQGVCYVPAGTYKVTGSVTLKSAVAVVGAGIGKTVLSGTTLTLGNHFFVGTSVTDASISDLTMNGPAAAAPPGTLDVRGVNTTGCTRCRFERLRISSVADGIDILGASNDSVIADNTITSAGNQGSAVQGDRNLMVRNRIDTVGSSNLHHGLYVQGGDGNVISENQISNVYGFCIHNFTFTTGQTISNNRIVSNYCKAGGLNATGVRGGIAFSDQPPATGIRQGVIIGNVIDSTFQNPIYVSAVSDVIVAENTIRNCQGDAITVQGSSGVAAERVMVRGNHVFGITVGGTGIRLTAGTGSVRNITVAENIIDTVFTMGIEGTTLTDSVIIGNRVKDYNTQGNAANSGIQLDTTSLRNIVSNNQVSTTTGTAAAMQIFASADADNVISNNIFLNNAGGSISDLGTRTFKYGNKLDTTDILARIPTGGPATVLTYGATISTDVSKGNYFLVTATNATQFLFNAPTNPTEGQTITYRIINTSGGALNATDPWTGSAQFKHSAWTQPATAFSRSISFTYNAGAGAWYQSYQSAVDVPN